MKLSKNEFKKIAKNATSIIANGRYTDFNNSTSQTETETTYEQMIEDLRNCGRWGADQYGNKIFACGSIASFTVYL